MLYSEMMQLGVGLRRVVPVAGKYQVVSKGEYLLDGVPKVFHKCFSGMFVPVLGLEKNALLVISCNPDRICRVLARLIYRKESDSAVA